MRPVAHPVTHENAAFLVLAQDALENRHEFLGTNYHKFNL
jgi:hypothetical protein